MRKNSDLDFQKARTFETNKATLRTLSPEQVASIPGLNRQSRRVIKKAQRMQSKEARA